MCDVGITKHSLYDQFKHYRVLNRSREVTATDNQRASEHRTIRYPGEFTKPATSGTWELVRGISLVVNLKKKKK